jgi:Ca2+-binding RTX toxin-like protein
MGNALTSADHIDGGAGNDEVDLYGDYTAGVTFKATTMVNVETLFLNSGSSYKLVMNDGNVAAGQTLFVDGDLLALSDTLIVNASAETDGHYYLGGGAGDDVLIGGQAGNTFFGHLGSDKMTAGSGADRFTYSGAADSTGVTRDIVTGFNAQHDKFDLPAGHSVAAIDAALTTGTLSAGSFDTNLAASIDAAHLAAGDAVLFTPDAGTLQGHTFLVVDMNGMAGYQAGADLVIQLESATHLDTLATTNFI